MSKHLGEEKMERSNWMLKIGATSSLLILFSGCGLIDSILMPTPVSPCPVISTFPRPQLDNIDGDIEDGFVILPLEEWEQINSNISKLQVGMENYELLIKAYNRQQAENGGN
jgi:hypothetical protein